MATITALRIAQTKESHVEEMEAHVGEMEARLSHLGAVFDELLSRAKGTSAEATTDYHRRVGELKEKYHVARGKLDEIRDAGSEKWKTLRTGLDHACNELEIAYKQLKVEHPERGGTCCGPPSSS